jgi:hypothetical protein
VPQHRTFAECFVAFTAATMIFETVNTCAANAFESIDILCGLIEATNLVGKYTEVLEDFTNFVHNELLIHAASPLSILQIVCDTAEYEFDYAVTITPMKTVFLTILCSLNASKRMLTRPLTSSDSLSTFILQPCSEDTLVITVLLFSVGIHGKNRKSTGRFFLFSTDLRYNAVIVEKRILKKYVIFSHAWTASEFEF